MATLGAMLDACVLIPAALCDVLLRCAAAGLYRLFWSEDILDEVERNLVEHGMTTAGGAARRIAAMRGAFPEAMIARAGYAHLQDVMTNHPKDRHVLAAAVAAGAQVIITQNLHDFPPAALEPFNIEAQSPNHFLVSLFDLDRELVVAIIREQAADLTDPPLSVDDVLDALAESAPKFADLVRALHYHILG